MRSGFTLVELLIVTAILAVVAAMAVRARGGPPVDGTARELSSVLLAAQNRAVMGQRDVVLRFDTVAGRLTLFEALDSGQVRTRGWTAPEGVRFGRHPAPALAVGGAAVTFRSPPGELPELTFHRSGSASEWGGLYLSSTRSRRGHPDEVRALEIDRGTGRITHWRHGAEGWVRR